MTNQKTYESQSNIGFDFKFPQRALVSAFSYALGWFSGIVVLNHPKTKFDREYRFHAWQSILLSASVFIARLSLEMLCGFGSTADTGVYSLASDFAGPVAMSSLCGALGLGGVVLWALAIVRTLHEQPFELPVLCRFARALSEKGAV